MEIQNKKDIQLENVSKIAYERYKEDWMNTHISQDARMQAKKEYLSYQQECMDAEIKPDSFDEWIEDVGYGGSIYVCYEEFCDMEYHDKEYICSLLGDTSLVELYYMDIANDEEE